MGTSEVEYRGKEFSALDSVLEVWLRLMVDAIDALDARPDWLGALRDDWFEQATEEFGFGIVPALDRHLTDDSRRLTLLAVAKTALRRLESLGDPITAASLNAIGAGRPDSRFRHDLPASVFLEPARAFIALLDDEPPP